MVNVNQIFQLLLRPQTPLVDWQYEYALVTPSSQHYSCLSLAIIVKQAHRLDSLHFRQIGLCDYNSQ